jgi:glycine cleavage system H protein
MARDAKTLKFTPTHEWIEPSGKRRKVGISDFAQSQLGDIVYVEFPDAGKEVSAGDEALIIESCKATASVYAPVAGKVVAYNKSLADDPQVINQSPYDDAWLFEIELSDGAEDSALLNHDSYLKTVNET